MKDKTVKALAAMICISSLEALALVFLGIDGIALAAVVGALAGLGGFELGRREDS